MSDSLPKQKNLISISQAAKFLGVSIDTIRRWDNCGVLRSSRPDGKNRYFSLSELEEHKSGRPLSISEAAKQLGVSPTTLRRLESRGLLKPERNNAGERVYNKDSLKNFQNSDYFLRKNHDNDYFRRKNHDNDYFLRKNQNDEKISNPLEEEKDFPEDSIALKKTQEIDPVNPETESNPPASNIGEVISNTYYKSSRRIPEILASVVIFILLSSIGVTNITISASQRLQSAQNPAVLSETITHEEPEEMSISAELTATEIDKSKAEPTADPVTLDSIQSLIDEAAKFDSKEASKAAEDEGGGPDRNGLNVILSIKSGRAEFINIREKPSTESGIIDEAREGDTFEMVSRDSNWYEIKLDKQLNGFISAEFAEIKEIN